MSNKHSTCDSSMDRLILRSTWQRRARGCCFQAALCAPFCCAEAGKSLPGIKFQHNVLSVLLQAYIVATRLLCAGGGPADSAALALLVTQQKLLHAHTNAASSDADAAQHAGVRAMLPQRAEAVNVFFNLLDAGC